MDWENLFDFGGEKEAERIKKHQKTPEEIARFSADESLSDVDRLVSLLRKGAPLQRSAVLENIYPQLFRPHTHGAATGDAGLPVCNASFEKLWPCLHPYVALGAASEGALPLEERRGALLSVANITASHTVAHATIAGKVVPAALKALARPPAPGATVGEASDAAEGCIEALCAICLTAFEAKMFSLESAKSEALGQLTALLAVTNATSVRVAGCRLLVALLANCGLAVLGGDTALLGTLVTMCQDVEARIRRTLVAEIPSLINVLTKAPAEMAAAPADATVAIAHAEASGAEASGTPAMPRSASPTAPGGPGAGAPPEVTAGTFLDELCELLHDDDCAVREAATAAALLALNPHKTTVMPNVRRRVLWPKVRDLLVLATTTAVTPTGLVMARQEDQCRRLFAKSISSLLYLGIRHGDVLLPRSALLGTAGDGAAVADADVPPPPRNRRLSHRSSLSSATAPTISLTDQPLSILSAIMNFLASIAADPSTEVRLSAARALPAIGITIMHALTAEELHIDPITPFTGRSTSSVASSARLATTRVGKAAGAEEVSSPKDVLFVSVSGATGDGMMPAIPDNRSPKYSVTLNDQVLTSDHSPAVLYAAFIRERLLPTVFTLAADSQESVRSTLTKGLHHIIAAFSGSRALRAFTAVLHHLLQDSSDAVVSPLIQYSSIWLPAMCSTDPLARLQSYSLLVPTFMSLWGRPLVAKSWRLQLSMFATFRLLTFLFPLPQVCEAALAIFHVAVQDGCKHVRKNAVASIVWFMRHGPSGRIRSLAKDYIFNRFASAKKSITQVLALLPTAIQSMTIPLLSTDDTSRSDPAAGQGAFKEFCDQLVPQPLPAAPPAAPSGSGATPSPVGCLSITSPSSIEGVGFGTSLLGPLWRRSCFLDAFAAALWLFSRSFIKETFLPPLLDIARSDPAIEIRISVLHALPLVRSWMSLPTDAAAVTDIVVCIADAAAEANPKIAAAAKAAQDVMRKLDTAVSAVLGPQISSAGKFVSNVLVSSSKAAAIVPTPPANMPPQSRRPSGYAGSATPVATGALPKRRSSAVTTTASGIRLSAFQAGMSGSGPATKRSEAGVEEDSVGVAFDSDDDSQSGSPRTGEDVANSVDTLSPEVAAGIAVGICLTREDAQWRAISNGVIARPLQVRGKFVGSLIKGTHSHPKDASKAAKVTHILAGAMRGSSFSMLSELLDGVDALTQSSPFLRSPFRLQVTSPMPTVPSVVVPPSSLMSHVSTGCTMISLDDVCGHQTGLIHGSGASLLWQDFASTGETAASHVSPAALQRSLWTLLPTCSATVSDDDITPWDDLDDAMSSTDLRFDFASARWMPSYLGDAMRLGRANIGTRAFHLQKAHPLQFCVSLPHVPAVEAALREQEQNLVNAAKVEDDAERRRVLEEQKKTVTTRVPIDRTTGTAVIPDKDVLSAQQALSGLMNWASAVSAPTPAASGPIRPSSASSSRSAASNVQAPLPWQPVPGFPPIGSLPPPGNVPVLVCSLCIVPSCTVPPPSASTAALQLTSQQGTLGSLQVNLLAPCNFGLLPNLNNPAGIPGGTASLVGVLQACGYLQGTGSFGALSKSLRPETPISQIANFSLVSHASLASTLLQFYSKSPQRAAELVAYVNAKVKAPATERLSPRAPTATSGTVSTPMVSAAMTPAATTAYVSTTSATVTTSVVGSLRPTARIPLSGVPGTIPTGKLATLTVASTAPVQASLTSLPPVISFGQSRTNLSARQGTSTSEDASVSSGHTSGSTTPVNDTALSHVADAGAPLESTRVPTTIAPVGGSSKLTIAPSRRLIPQIAEGTDALQPSPGVRLLPRVGSSLPADKYSASSTMAAAGRTAVTLTGAGTPATSQPVLIKSKSSEPAQLSLSKPPIITPLTITPTGSPALRPRPVGMAGAGKFVVLSGAPAGSASLLEKR